MIPKGADRPLPCLVWVHSGGYIMRSAAQDDSYCRHLVNALECVIVNVDYRLAPEHPYPAGLEDCYTALLWAKSFDAVDNSRIAIAGASGGGGLAAALGLLARERGEVRLVAQVLSYPMLDDRSSSRSDINKRYHRVWSVRSNEYAWSSYLGTADRDVAVPGRRADLAGLPPTWLGTGDRDLFHDEIVSYGQRLDAAGVPTQIVVVPGAFHGFDVIAPRKHISRSYFDSQVAALRAAFDATTPDRPHAPSGP